MFQETCIAPVNIALIKYWGKRDEDLILPINDSLSMTLSTDEVNLKLYKYGHGVRTVVPTSALLGEFTYESFNEFESLLLFIQMCAKTTTVASKDFEKNRMWLNGEEVPFEENARLMRCITELKKLAALKNVTKFPVDWKLQIRSKNNFPTAAGLASSAAGYACLVYSLACLYGVEGEELTSIARQGSGSACRSLYGGFVRWKMGNRPDGADSIAVSVAPATHWPNMHVLILVVNDTKKKTSSTKGMQRSVLTSDLINHRAEECVPSRIADITSAIERRDFEKFAEITMKDSNQFHAIALDTYPPCVYMNDVSHLIADFVHVFNERAGCTKVAYTFDAGPNACLYLLEENVPSVLKAVQTCFPSETPAEEYLKGLPIEESEKRAEKLLEGLSSYGTNLLKYVIHTKIGNGPRRVSQAESV